MNFTEIEQLIGKFYEGATTPEEERQLREFFSQEEIPPHLAVHAGLFRFYEESEKETIPDPGFEDKLLARLGETPVIPLYSRRKQFVYLAGMAAAFLLLVGLFFTFRNDVLRHSYSDKEAAAAYMNAQKALLLLSSNLNTGLDQVQRLDNFQHGLDHAAKLQNFQKGLDNMNKLSKFYQYQPFIINPDGKTRP
ncbi:MAG: hypothetical protein NTU98_02460 [Bacteroidetes bacterium]|nr:hypothetical protein [Bacteroidota bacterium]